MTEQKEKIESSFEVFQKEISRWKEEQLEKKNKCEEKKKRGEKVIRDDLYDPHAEDINPNYLTEADRIIWEKVKNRTLTMEELSIYAQQVEDELIKAEPEVARSRRTFYELINNKAQVLLLKKQFEELKKIEKEKEEK